MPNACDKGTVYRPWQAQVEQWIDFTTTELDSPLLSWILPLLGHWPYDKKVR